MIFAKHDPIVFLVSGLSMPSHCLWVKSKHLNLVYKQFDPYCCLQVSTSVPHFLLTFSEKSPRPLFRWGLFPYHITKLVIITKSLIEIPLGGYGFFSSPSSNFCLILYLFIQLLYVTWHWWRHLSLPPRHSAFREKLSSLVWCVKEEYRIIL